MLHSTFEVDGAELEAIRAGLDAGEAIERPFPAVLVDDEGGVHAEIEKVVRIRRRGPPRDAGRAPCPHA